jgi:branched-chain amino acid transport system substrate-binding protein
VGVLLPLTGDTSVAGLKIQRGYQLAAEEINSLGGVTIEGRSVPLKLVFADSEGKPEVGVSETERLIQSNNVAAIAGCYQSNVAFPTTATAEKYHTPYVVDNPIADKITERGFKYTFRVTLKSSWMAKAQIDFLKNMQKLRATPIRRVALLYEDTLFGQSSAEGQRKYANEAGYEVVADLSYAHSATDVSATIARLKAAKPDVVIATSYTSDAILIGRTMKEQRFFPKLALLGSTAGHQDPDFIASLGKDAENVLTTSFWNSDLRNGAALRYYESYRKRFGEDPVPQCTNARAALWVLRDALNRAGTSDHEMLRKALAATNLQAPQPPVDIMPFATIRFGEDGQNNAAQSIIMQVQSGKFVTVWPAQVAAAEIVWPGIPPTGIR